MIRYDVPSVLLDRIIRASDDIKMIDREENEITIFPDHVNKRNNTIASGVVINSADSIYPCAVPDLGCSFHIVELAGIRESNLKRCPLLFKQLDAFLAGELGSLFSGDDHEVIADMIEKGCGSTSGLFPTDRTEHYENNGKYEIDHSVPLSAEIFPWQVFLNNIFHIIPDDFRLGIQNDRFHSVNLCF